MSATEYGFFLGVAPGVCYTLWNLMSAQRVWNEAQGIAREHGEILVIDASPAIRFNYLFRPGRFIRPEDGEGVRQAKARLLSIRKRFLRRHVVGGLLIVLGGFLGVVIALGIGTD